MDIKRIVMAGGVLATAGAIGFVMQNGESAKARYAQASVPDISGTAAEPMEVTGIALTSSVIGAKANVAEPRTEMQAQQDAAVAGSMDAPAKEAPVVEVKTAALDEDVAPETDALAPPASLCDIEMTATPVAAAMVDIAIAANCYPNERVTLHHSGMMFTEETDKDGNLSVSIPAMSESAVFIAAFANGEGALADAKVPSLEFYDRMVVQSKASSELHINAFEFGADFRDEGHVSLKSDRSMADAAKGKGGFITSLGDASQAEALVAEVYTFPTSTVKQQGEVHVSVDAEVTSANCGLRVEAQTLEVSGAGALKVQDLTLPIPSCEAVGDFLVLQNLLQDLKVARN
ncbi:hypothetical protein [Planktotalea sp.]|uniref:hypothetical protein n=1 Tax=Planktotalea sp. TaxID=2029877 RepID=UPI003D6B8939